MKMRYGLAALLCLLLAMLAGCAKEVDIAAQQAWRDVEVRRAEAHEKVVKAMAENPAQARVIIKPLPGEENVSIRGQVEVYASGGANLGGGAVVTPEPSPRPATQTEAARDVVKSAPGEVGRTVLGVVGLQEAGETVRASYQAMSNTAGNRINVGGDYNAGAGAGSPRPGGDWYSGTEAGDNRDNPAETGGTQ